MRKFTYVSLAALAVALLPCTPAMAQDDDADIEEDGQIIVTGVRGRDRTIADSPVPIDVFSADDISSVSFTDTNDVLKTLVPSYTLSRQPISDGSSFIRPASLRGLAVRARRGRTSPPFPPSA